MIVIEWPSGKRIGNIPKIKIKCLKFYVKKTVDYNNLVIIIYFIILNNLINSELFGSL